MSKNNSRQSQHEVVIFRPYPFQVGQKIFVQSGPRHGDGEVIGVDERQIRLKCPVSFREFVRERFCYLVETRQDEPWPHRD